MNADNQNELISITLGETLRLAREAKSLSIDAVAAEIHVRPSTLRAIEADDTARIARVYLVGYIRRYAQHLGVPSAEVERLLHNAPCSEPAVQSVFSEALPRDRSERWFKASSYVLASAVVIALVWQFTTEAVRFSQGETRTRSTAGALNPGLPGETAESVTGSDAARPAPARIEPSKSHLRASLAAMESGRSSLPDERRSVAEEAWAAVGGRGETAGSPAAADATPAALAISTSADSWVEIIDGNGEKIEMDLLRAGSRRQYRGPEPFRLLLGRASAIELSFNGTPIDLAPHTRGNVARVTLGGDPDEAASQERDGADRPPKPPAGEGADRG